jgi:hypothetical protein
MSAEEAKQLFDETCRRLLLDPEKVARLHGFEIAEVRLVSQHLVSGLKQGTSPPWLFDPSFPGSGVVSSCRGDLLAGTTLVEVKAGNRGFRAEDVRQVLVYLALNYVARQHEITHMMLLNPRSGHYSKLSVTSLCLFASGLSENELLESIIFGFSLQGTSV